MSTPEIAEAAGVTRGAMYHQVIGALDEAAMCVASAQDHAQEALAARAVVHRLIDGLLTRPTPRPG